MADFDRWQEWGHALNDADFARAWAALGVAAGSDASLRLFHEHSRGLPMRDRRPIEATTARLAVALPLIYGDDALQPRTEDAVVAWTFPASPAHEALLRSLPPSAWARAWPDAITALRPPRLRVTAYPEKEAIRPWYRLIAEVDPSPSALSIAFDPLSARLFVDWPLRLGALPGNPGAAIRDAVRERWPSERLTRAIMIGRDQANCDVLLHVGTPESLRAALDVLPAPCNTDLLMLFGDPGADPVALHTRVMALVDSTHASGLVVINVPPQPDEAVVAINDFIAHLSHDEPFDRALFAGLSAFRGADPMSWLSPRLADLRLTDVATRVASRVTRLPRGAHIDLSRLGRPETVRKRGRRPLEGAMTGPADLTRVSADAYEIDVHEMSFDRESHGASDLVVLAEAVAAAAEPPEAETRRTPRFIQQQSFVQSGKTFKRAEGGFVAGVPATVCVRIGPEDAEWNSLPGEFPVERLPREYGEWRLTVWLTEPDQLEAPLQSSIVLPREGPSSEGTFSFTPRGAGDFEGRLTVMHRGRVLQTAVLRAAVRAVGEGRTSEGSPRLDDLLPVRHRLGDLDDRRQFDLAFVLNRSGTHVSRAVALSSTSAWVANLDESLKVAGTINALLGEVAKSVQDYEQGLSGEMGRELLVKLAHAGAWLQVHLVEEQLQANGNRADIASKEYIQIVSTKTDAVVPFEFIYDYEVPDDNATVCSAWREGVAQGACPPTCEPTSSKTVCPMGFWGMRKVIERHTLSPEYSKEGRELFLQSEPGRHTSALKLGRTAVVATSHRVKTDDLKPLLDALKAHLIDASTAATWDEWARLVASLRPGLLLALPHTYGSGSNVSLEIGDVLIKTIQIKALHVCARPEDGQPLVALLGCDTAGTADDYGKHVAVFRARGAAVVVATVATVFGGHAALVAAKLARGLVPPEGAPQVRLGEAIRTLKRQALLDNLLMPLCLVAYGDADWYLTR